MKVFHSSAPDSKIRSATPHVNVVAPKIGYVKFLGLALRIVTLRLEILKYREIIFYVSIIRCSLRIIYRIVVYIWVTFKNEIAFNDNFLIKRQFMQFILFTKILKN